MPAAAQAAIAAVTEPSLRVLIADDSVVARAVLGQMVGDDDRFTVAASVGSVRAALAFLKREVVDVVLLDVALPGRTGMAAVSDLVQAGRGARLMIVCSAADQGSPAVSQAMALGAVDTIVRPAAPGENGFQFRRSLFAKLEKLAEPPRSSPVSSWDPSPASRGGMFDVVAIGASTGGIHALGHVLGVLPADFRPVILVTQHLPVSFIPYFAAQLTLLARRPAEVATNRMRVRPGQVIVAPGDAHIRCVSLPDGGLAVRLSDERAASGCTPSVDPMLASLAQVRGARAMGVVLSGMGRDGVDGARALSAAGGCIVAQDRASSVVWGMPGAVAPFADALLSPEAIGALVASGQRP